MSAPSPVVEVRAACGEPRDRLRRCWFGSTGGADTCRRAGSRGSSLALLGTSTIGWKVLSRTTAHSLTEACPFPPMVERFRHPTLAPFPPVVEVPAACSEPRDRLRRCWFGSTGGADTCRRAGSRGSSLALLGTSTIGTSDRRFLTDGRPAPRWSRCEPRAASLETACSEAGSSSAGGADACRRAGSRGSSLSLLGTSTNLDHRNGSPDA